MMNATTDEGREGDVTIVRKDRGELLYLPAIMERTGMPEGTIRSRYHRGDMPCLWKLGRRLVAWERDLEAWLDEQRAATTKTRDDSAPTEDEPPGMWERSDFDSPEEVR